MSSGVAPVVVRSGSATVGCDPCKRDELEPDKRIMIPMLLPCRAKTRWGTEKGQECTCPLGDRLRALGLVVDMRAGDVCLVGDLDGKGVAAQGDHGAAPGSAVRVSDQGPTRDYTGATDQW